MPRAVTEWVGKHPDSAIPPRVKVRILHKQDFKCAITGLPIPAGVTPEFDHIKELILGGEHRETNLQAILPEPHKEKTKEAMGRKAKADAGTKSAYGLNAPKQKIASRGFEKHEKVRAINKSELPELPRRMMFR